MTPDKLFQSKSLANLGHFALVAIMQCLIACDVCGQAPTIDRLTTSSGYTYNPGGRFDLIGSNDVYYLNDGSTWSSGAGVFRESSYAFTSAMEHDATLTFDMTNLRESDVLISYQDVNSGDHATFAELRAFGPMHIIADGGSSAATLHGFALVYSNPPWINPLPGYQYHFLTSPVGTVVPFSVEYELLNDTWDANIFSRTFSYQTTGEFRFSEFRAIPEPSTTAMCVVALLLVSHRHQRF